MSEEPMRNGDGTVKPEAENNVKPEAKRYIGKVTQWFTTHQTGFMSCEEFKSDITIDYNHLSGDVARLRANDEVSFLVEIDDKGRPRAREVKLVHPPSRNRIKGICMTWNTPRHCGFLKSDEWKEGMENIYCPASEIIRKIEGTKGVMGGPAQIDLKPGEIVEFEVDMHESRISAFNVKRMVTDTDPSKWRIVLKYPSWITDHTETQTPVICIDRIPKTATIDRIKALFEAGEVINVEIDSDSQTICNSALVTLTGHDKARQSVAKLSNMYMESLKLEVNLRPSKAELDVAFAKMGVDPQAKPIVKFVHIAGPLTRIQGGRVFLKRHNQYNKIVLMNAHRDVTSHEVWETFKMLGAVQNVEIGGMVEGGRRKCYISFADPILADVVAKEYDQAGLNDEFTKFSKDEVKGVQKLGIWEFAKKAKALSFMGGGLWLKPCKTRRESNKPGRMPRHDTSTCIYVMNIINGVTEQDMGKVFAHLGDVEAVKLKPVSEQCAVGFVYFDSKPTVERILREYNDAKLNDKSEWRKLPVDGDYKPPLTAPKPAAMYRKRPGQHRSMSHEQHNQYPHLFQAPPPQWAYPNAAAYPAYAGSYGYYGYYGYANPAHPPAQNPNPQGSKAAPSGSKPAGQAPVSTAQAQNPQIHAQYSHGQYPGNVQFPPQYPYGQQAYGQYPGASMGQNASGRGYGGYSAEQAGYQHGSYQAYGNRQDSSKRRRVDFHGQNPSQGARGSYGGSRS
ncbi:hypothetical protein AAMO2058_001446100 [Amorphochlora amoebiformis]